MSESGSRTPLPEIDRTAAAALWARYLDASGDPADPPWSDLSCFGDSVELADELLSLVLDGPKRATACAVAELDAEGLPIPTPGDRWIACDGAGRPRVVLRTSDVRVGPLSSVDAAFAWDEGEGDRTVEDWLRMHDDYYRRTFAAHGWTYHHDIPVVFERFEVVYAEPAGAPAPG